MPANLNSLKNGTRLKRLTVGELPRPMTHLKREARGYRRALEAETLLAVGEINVTAAHAIDTATAATIHSGICRWLINKKLDGMSVADGGTWLVTSDGDAAAQASGLKHEVIDLSKSRLYDGWS